jgi:hypothetical protein
VAPLSVVRVRLRNHGLAATTFASAAAVVRAFGAMQAQDYPGALWGIAQRTKGATEGDVEDAIGKRAIVRTWPMRGTLHFVAPELVRPMLRLLAPRVVRRAARRYGELGLDEGTLRKSGRVLERALRAGKEHTRDELYELLAGSGIATDGQRGIHILGYLAMERLICFGVRRAKQPTFVLLDEWLEAKDLADDELPGELARRYFTTHGPASVRDFAWWTGLSLGEAKKAASAAGDLKELVVDERVLWTSEKREASGDLAHLLPAYDEYTVAYRERGDFLDPAHHETARGGIFSPVIVRNGELVGTWTRKVTTKKIAITARLFRPIAHAWLATQAARYGQFAGAPTTLTVERP